MTFEASLGSFSLSVKDAEIINHQRAITKSINDHFIQVGAVFLKASGKMPVDEDWTKRLRGDTDLQSWIDDPTFKFHNVGFNLQQGWVDVDIDAEDPEFNACMQKAMQFLAIDTRFGFGRKSVGCATHYLVQLGEEEASTYDILKRFEPREFRIDGRRYHVQLRSYAANTSAANVAKEAKQTVMPGSIYSHKKDPGQYDLSVWWRANGTIAEKYQQVASTTPRKVNFNELVRAVTFATFLFIIQKHWVTGSRQVTAQKVTGWLARLVRDGNAINNHEALSEDVFCPVDDDDTAERLIAFVCDALGDDEKHMRLRAYRDARDKLERNPDAKVPGWPALEQLLGGAETNALRTVFMPGSDVSHLTIMAERYIYDESNNTYVDRTRFRTQGNFVHEGPDLERRHKGDTVRVGGKPREAFKVFESSDMRKRIGMCDLYPELNPGGIYRISAIGDVLSDEDDSDVTALPIFNTWRGWSVQPAAVVNPELMAKCHAMLDQVLAYLTRDNAAQADWIKKWLAWTVQHPGDKQQIAWVVVGGQGVGKSFIGNTFTRAIFGQLWGSASPQVIDQRFNIGPFKDKMFVFVDEAKFHGDTSTDEVKKLIRNVDVPGMEKFSEARNYRVFARLMFASNRFDMNIGQANVRDRALFYTKAYDKDHLQQSELEFRAWTETLKPFFQEFAEMLARKDVREHYMRMFMEVETNRYEIESIKLSSSNDPSIVDSNMSYARRIAKWIIEDGRIYEDLDISFPFTSSDIFKRVGEVCKEMGLQPVQGQRVLNEYIEADVVEQVNIKGARKFRFRWKIASLHERFGESISSALEARYEFTEEDYGINENDGTKRLPWRGQAKGVVQSHKF